MLPKDKYRSDDCASLLARCQEVLRQEVFISLSHERLQRKYNDIIKIFQHEGESNWNETFYILFMRVLGDELNREPFMEVARRLPLHRVMRERGSIKSVEALLLGTSGLLENYSNDEYAYSLSQEADFLLHKYNVTPLSHRHWNFARVRPNNHPVVRLSQMASIICSHEFIFNDMLCCRTQSDVDALFTASATPHLLSTHPHLVASSPDVEGEGGLLGEMKRHLIGINLVVPMQYAYGNFIHDDEICAQAHNLNEDLRAESNRYIRKWQSQGVNPRCALESQALIQLTTVYCKKSLCEKCPVNRYLRR